MFFGNMMLRAAKSKAWHPSWSKVTTGLSGAWVLYGGFYAGGTYVVVGADSSFSGAFLATSSSGTSWTQRTSGLSGAGGLLGGFYAGGTYVVVGEGSSGGPFLATSSSGTSWTQRTSGLSGAGILLGGFYAGGTYVVVGSDEYGYVYVALSDDAVSWGEESGLPESFINGGSHVAFFDDVDTAVIALSESAVLVGVS